MRRRINKSEKDVKSFYNYNLQKLAHADMEAKKSPNLPSASCRTRKASGVIRSKFKGLRTRYLRKGSESICPQKDLHIQVLFVTTTNWKQLRSPSTGSWINKLWYIHRMEYYLSIKRNELLTHVLTWINFQIIMLSEKRQIKKYNNFIYIIIPCIYREKM